MAKVFIIFLNFKNSAFSRDKMHLKGIKIIKMKKNYNLLTKNKVK